MIISFSSSRTIAWAVWIFASIFYAYQFILKVMPSIMLNDIMTQFNMDAATFGQFSGIYYLGYSLAHLPLGIMLDRFGPKKIMTGSLFLIIIGLMPLLLATHWIYAILGRFLVGIGSSAAILGVFKVIRISFNAALFPRMLSFSVAIGLLGAIYGGGPVSYIQGIVGYQKVIELFALLGLGLAAITYWIIPNGHSDSKQSILSDIKEVLSNKKVIGSCICAGLMVGPLEGFADVWGTLFFQKIYGYDVTISASLPSMIFLGMCVGAPLLSLIADKIKDYLLTIIGAGLIMTVGFCFLIVTHLSFGILVFNLLLIGICCAYQILAIYKASTYVREEVAGLTTAIANMIIMFFGYAFHTLIGQTINFAGGSNTPIALISGILIIPIALCMGSCGYVLLYKTEKKQQYSTLNN